METIINKFFSQQQQHDEQQRQGKKGKNQINVRNGLALLVCLASVVFVIINETRSGRTGFGRGARRIQKSRNASSSFGEEGGESHAILILLYHKTGHHLYRDTLKKAFDAYGFFTDIEDCKRVTCSKKELRRRAFGDGEGSPEEGEHVMKATAMRLLEYGYDDLSKVLPGDQLRVIHMIRPVEDHVLSYYRYHVKLNTPEHQFKYVTSPCKPERSYVEAVFNQIGFGVHIVDELVADCKKIWKRSYNKMLPAVFPGSFLNTLWNLKINGKEEDAIRLMFYHTIFSNEPNLMAGYKSEILTMVSNEWVMRNHPKEDTRIQYVRTPLDLYMDLDNAHELVYDAVDFAMAHRDPMKARNITNSFINLQHHSLKDNAHVTQGKGEAVSNTSTLRKVLITDPVIGPYIHYFNTILGFNTGNTNQIR